MTFVNFYKNAYWDFGWECVESADQCGENECHNNIRWGLWPMKVVSLSAPLISPGSVS